MLTLSEYQRDLGKIRIHQPKSFTINIINPTDHDIEITEIRRGCGKCTQARVDSTIVKANSFVPLHVTFTPDSTGINRKSISINKQSVLTFTANVYS
jgi:hypothetical protein